MKRLRDLMRDENHFSVGAELVTTRGIIMQDDSAKIVQFANDLCNDTDVDWISVTDNAGRKIPFEDSPICIEFLD